MLSPGSLRWPEWPDPRCSRWYSQWRNHARGHERGPEGTGQIHPDEPLAVIGDVHGCDALLERLLERIGRDLPEARIVLVGDLIDRGPDSAGTLRRAMALDPQAVVLRGNHEQMLIELLTLPPQGDGVQPPSTAMPPAPSPGAPESHENSQPPSGSQSRLTRMGLLWLRSGGMETLRSYGISPDSFPDLFPPEILADPTRPGNRTMSPAQDATLDQVFVRLRLQLLAALPPGTLDWLLARPRYWTSGNVAVAHAGADPRLPLAEQNPDNFLWGHPGTDQRARRDGLWLIRGHVVVPSARVRMGLISIDTGAYRTGRLSAALITPGRLHFACETLRSAG